jgi:hypothetical protein
VTVLATAPSITVTKTPSSTTVPEPGASVTFTVRVENTSNAQDPVTIDTLVDDVHGSLDGQGSCALPQLIPPASFYQCAFSATVSGNAGDSETDTVTASGQDDEGTTAGPANDSATVTVTDVVPVLTVTKEAVPASLPEPGGEVTFNLRIDNDSVAGDPVTIDSLTDDIYGDLLDLTDEGGSAKLQSGTTCTLPQAISPGGFYECTFSAEVTGDPDDSETDTVTASGADDEGTPAAGADSATVTITGLAPSIVVAKSASPTTVPEPGASVTFTVQIDNTSGVADPVTIDSLIDDVHGDLNAQGSCSTPQVIQPAASYSCSFSATVNGVPGDTETDTVTASGQDDDGVAVNGNDGATVTVTDVAPAISVAKSASPTTFFNDTATTEIYTVRVTNDSVSSDTVSLTALDDSIYGDVTDITDEGGTVKEQLSSGCALPQAIASSSFYECSFTATVSGNAGDSETDTVAASVTDEEGTRASGGDSATVTVTGTGPQIRVTKTASTSTVTEPGGAVTFTIQVDNESVAGDPVTLLTLTDDVHGNLHGQGDCATGGVIQPQASYSCSFTVQVTGNAGEVETDTVTATGEDDELESTAGADSATVTVKGAAPSITVTKTPSSPTVSEPSGPITFTVRVDNTSNTEDPVTRQQRRLGDRYGDRLGPGRRRGGGERERQRHGDGGGHGTVDRGEQDGGSDLGERARRQRHLHGTGGQHLARPGPGDDHLAAG